MRKIRIGCVAMEPGESLIVLSPKGVAYVCRVAVHTDSGDHYAEPAQNHAELTEAAMKAVTDYVVWRSGDQQAWPAPGNYSCPTTLAALAVWHNSAA